jgi:hypothetical protein
MKTKSFIFSGIIVLSLLFTSSSIYAFGLGLYGTASKGSTEWTGTNNDTSKTWEKETDDTKKGLGFTLDTALAFDTLFNYRLQIGFNKIKMSGDNNWDFEGKEYHLYNNFGFGIFRSEIVRIWLGPQIGFGWFNTEYQNLPSNAVVEENKFWTIFYSYGIILGFNFNFGDVVTIAIDGGYRLRNNYGNWSFDYRVTTTHIYGDNDMTGKGKEAFVDVSFMFRIGDTF